MKRYFEGSDATNIGETTQEILENFFKTAIDAEPTISGTTGLCPAGVLVTTSRATAKTRFQSQDNEAFVLLLQNTHNDPFKRIQILDNAGNVTAVAGGRRHEWTFLLQVSARNNADARSSPSKVPASDRKLADFVCRTFNNGYRALQILGVFETSIKADADNQNNPNVVNPHLLKCVTYTIES